jgi:hypothetical protein
MTTKNELTSFLPLLYELHDQTCIMSSTSSMKNVSAYKKIKEMRDGALPVILEGLRLHIAEIPLMLMAYEILRFDPVPEHYAGRVRVMSDIWIAVLKEELGYNQ